MSETETAVETAPATEANHKPTKVAKPKAKPKAKKAKPALSSGITGAQYRVLKATVGKALTRKRIAEKAFNGNSVNFVPIITPLVKAKLLKEDNLGVDERGKPTGNPAETVFTCTALGKKVVDNGPPARATKAEHQSLPKVGGSFTKTYKGKDVKVTVVADGFRVSNKTYSSLTAAAQGVRGSDASINGWVFFGLTK